MVPTPPDKDDRALSSDLAPQRFAATLVGLVIGQLAGDKSVVVAKVFLYWKDGSAYKQWQVIEISLIMILLVLSVGVLFGIFMKIRGWTNYEQIVWSVVAAIVAAFFVIVEQSLPPPVVDSESELWENIGKLIYYLGWLVGLLLVPIILLPNPKPGFDSQIERGVGLLMVSVVMLIVCWFAGAVLIEIAKYVHNLLCEIMRVKEAANLADPMKFWLASPSAVNPICGLFFVVAFSPIWWEELWRYTKSTKAWLWIGSFIAYTIIYAGIFGGVFYTARGWACFLVACDLASAWQFFLAFGAFPAVVAVTVLLAFWLTRREKTPNAVGWRVSARFWWFLPPGLAIGFAMVALFGFGPLARSDGASWPQIIVLATAHAVNGALLGSILRISKPTSKWTMKLIRIT